MSPILTPGAASNRPRRRCHPLHCRKAFSCRPAVRPTSIWRFRHAPYMWAKACRSKSKWAYAPGIVTSVNGLPTLKGSDFTFNNLSKQPERREEDIEGGDFVVLTWHSALAAVKPGDFSLSAETPVP